MDLENRDNNVGKMYHYKLQPILPEWSPLDGTKIARWNGYGGLFYAEAVD